MEMQNLLSYNYAPSGLFQSNAAPPQLPIFHAGVAPTPSTSVVVQQPEVPYAPLILNLDLTSEKAQTNFLLEQQDR